MITLALRIALASSLCLQGNATTGLKYLLDLPSPGNILLYGERLHSVPAQNTEQGEKFMHEGFARTNDLVRQFLRLPRTAQRSALHEFLKKSREWTSVHYIEQDLERKWDVDKLDLISLAEGRGACINYFSVCVFRPAKDLPGLKENVGVGFPDSGPNSSLIPHDASLYKVAQKLVDGGKLDWPNPQATRVWWGTDLLRDLYTPYEVWQDAVYGNQEGQLIDAINDVLSDFWTLPVPVQRKAMLAFLDACQTPHWVDYDATKLDFLAVAAGRETRLVSPSLYFLTARVGKPGIAAIKGLHPAADGPAAVKHDFDKSKYPLARALVRSGYFDPPVRN